MLPLRLGTTKTFNVETNSDANATNYPGLIYLLHKDDVTAGSSSWAPRIGNMVINSSVAYGKDANGVSVASTPVFTATGTPPVITKNKYLLTITVGTPGTNGHICTFDFGDSTTGDAVKANGAVFFNTTQYITAIFEASVPTGQSQCHISYSDWVAASPSVFRVLAPRVTSVPLTYQGVWATTTSYAINDLVDQGINTYVCLVAHTSGTFATDLAANLWTLRTLTTETVTANNTVNIAPSVAGVNCIPNNTINMGGFLGTIDTQRFILGAVFVLSNPLSKTFVQSACIWMAANQGKLYPGFRGLT